MELRDVCFALSLVNEERIANNEAVGQRGHTVEPLRDRYIAALVGLELHYQPHSSHDFHLGFAVAECQSKPGQGHKLLVKLRHMFAYQKIVH